MKTPLLAVLLATMTFSATPLLQAQGPDAEAFVIRALHVEGNHTAIVRVATQTGQVWLLENDEWAPLTPPQNLTSGDYDCALTAFGKKSWVLTLWNTANGQTYIYASATQGWRYARDPE